MRRNINHPNVIMRVLDLRYAFALVFLVSVGSNAQVMSLDSVLLLVRKQNPMLQEYEHRKKALDAYADGASSWMAPISTTPISSEA